MNKRLSCVLSHIPDGIGLIDVGTDHAYLPIALAERGYPGRLYASDLRPGPLRAAERNAASASVTERITFLLADGLDACDPALVDTIVVAGMGGDTICGIFDRAEWIMDPRYTLVLQPMTRCEVLRYWLIHNEFAIVEEDLVEDGGVLYAVLKAKIGKSDALSDAELFTGSEGLLREHPLYPRFLAQQLERFRRVLRGRTAAAAPEESSGSTAVIGSIVRQMEEMAERAKTD